MYRLCRYPTGAVVGDIFKEAQVMIFVNYFENKQINKYYTAYKLFSIIINNILKLLLLFTTTFRHKRIMGTSWSS